MERPSTSMLRYATRVGAVFAARDDAASAGEASIVQRDAAAKVSERIWGMASILLISPPRCRSGYGVVVRRLQRSAICRDTG
jgi:hypothetical protein